VTITVDDADSERCVVGLSGAVVKRKAVPGFEEIPADNLGENAFIGTVRREETHIGVSALHGVLIVGATLAGYDPTPENTAKLICLTRKKNALPKPLCTENRRN
jgi:hypothetical protein